MKKSIYILIGVIIILVFGLSGRWYYKNKTTLSTQSGTVFNQGATTPTQNKTAGWQTYKNEKYGYEFKYPKDEKVIIFVDVDAKNNIITPPTSSSDNVSITDNSREILFGGDYSAFNVLAVQKKANLTLNTLVNDYLKAVDDVRSNQITIDGHKAVEITGKGYINSPYKRLYIDTGNYIISLSENIQTNMLDSVYSTFKLTK